MDRILVQGGRPLSGTIRINGAKNAALPLMTAALLTDEPLVLENTPDVADIGSMWRLLQHLGCEARHLAGEPHKLALTCGKILATTAPYDIVRKMRASVLVLGPLLARAGAAKVSLPGGCAIGTRPIDMHLSAMERLGAEIVLEGGYVLARAPNGLRGGEVRFSQPSVGATENVLMAACLARGETYILGAAREPEIVDLAACLTKMGALIEGAGTHEIRVQGVERLAGATHAVVPDRIEAGTYVMAAGITAGSLTIEGARSEHFGTAAETLRRAGIALEATPHGLKAGLADGSLIGTDMMTRPFPGFRHGLASAVHGPHVWGRRGRHDHRDHLRESLHARAGTGSPWRPDHRPRRLRPGPRRGSLARCPSDGDGFACLGLARSRGTRRRGRDRG